GSRYGQVSDEFRMLIEGGYGKTPAPISDAVARAGAERQGPARPASAAPPSRGGVRGGAAGPASAAPPSVEDVADEAGDLAASEEELVLLAMFGEQARTLLETIRARHSGTMSLIAGDVDSSRAERIREIVQIVQESGVGEIEIEDEGMRVSVRKADEVP